MSIQNFDNLANMFFSHAKSYAESPILFKLKDGLGKKDKLIYEPYSWQQVADLVKCVGAALLHNNIQIADRVGILSNTRIEWTMADIGIISSGAITTTLYHTCSSEEVYELISDSGLDFLFIEDKKQLDKIINIQDKINLKGLVVFEPIDEEKLQSLNCKFSVINWSSFIESGKNALNQNPQILQNIYNSIKKEDIASIVYTSGTGGKLKGAVLTHGNFLAQIDAIPHTVPINRPEPHALLAFLPSAHIFHRVAGQWYFMSQNCPIYYCSRMEKIAQYLAETPAQVILSVPLLLSKIKDKTTNKINELNPKAQLIVKNALKIGSTLKKAELNATSFTMRNIARLGYKAVYESVLKQIKEKISPSLKAIISGGAPISGEILEFFQALGIYVIEGYGLTETTGILCANSAEKAKIGSVGKPLKGVEVKIAEDGEIIAKGEIIFQSYWNNEISTQEALNEDKWFLTGDIGHLDDENNLFITGRKKDLIINSGGKKISPALIEEKVKSSSFIEQIAVFGDQQKWLIALITLNQEAVLKALNLENNAETNWGKLIDGELVKDLIEKDLAFRCEGLAEYEKIKRFKILAEHFGQAKAELTHTMKLKRKVIQQNYAQVIDNLYRV
jgi:long-chain acyl-CoA synthetase